MLTGTVYRPAHRDAHGDPVDTEGNPVRLSGDGTAKLGTITGIIIGARTVENLQVRGNVVSIGGLIGVPVSAPILLQAGDIVETDGCRYAIEGSRLWGRPHSLTGTPARYAWWKATAN